jgi:hypothetical protein
LQETPTDGVEWEEEKIRRGSASIAAMAGDKLVDKEKLLTKMGGERLRMELDNVLWRGDIEHLNLNTLWGYFTDYTYLPRMRDFDVLRRSVQDGLSETMHVEQSFGVASRFDEARQRYVDLVLPPNPGARIDRSSLLVKPAIAKAQHERDEEERRRKRPVVTVAPDGPQIHTLTNPPSPDIGTRGDGEDVPFTPPLHRQKTHFFGEVILDAAQVASSAAQIQAEVLRHLSQLPGAQVSLRLQVDVTYEEGFDEQTVRTVSENCNTLGFQDHDFD